MPANSEHYPWPSYYGHFKFFEMRMVRHNRITNLSKLEDGIYELNLTSGDVLRAFICECYSFSVAEFYEVINKNNNLQIIVIDSIWCGYTSEAKDLAISNCIGLFKINELMGALNQLDYWNYVPPEK